MKTLKDVYPLPANQILVRDWAGHHVIKRVVIRAGDTPTAFTQPIHGAAVKKLKGFGYKFLPETVWPWNKEGKIEGFNPSLPDVVIQLEQARAARAAI